MRGWTDGWMWRMDGWKSNSAHQQLSLYELTNKQMYYCFVLVIYCFVRPV